MSSPTGMLCRLCFDERAKLVYWDKANVCRANGPDKAECLLETDHGGKHEGYGYDNYGPVYRSWFDKRKRTSGSTSATTRGG